MKKVTIMIAIAAIVLCMMPTVSLASEGDTYGDGTFNYIELADGTLSVTGYVGGGGAVVIPSSYDPGSGSMSVTAIGANAFLSNNTITSVSIPSGVTTIGYQAFRNCDALTSITVPASVTSIGDYAISYCDGLTSVTLEDGLSVIGNYMIYRCTILGSITIPSSVTAIGVNVLGGCHNLSSVTLSDGLTVIGQNMFYNLDALTSITIPSSINSIGDKAFMYCDGLTSVTLSDGLTTIGSNMFRECTALGSITIPSSVTSVGTTAFYGSPISKAVIHSKTVTFGASCLANTDLGSDGIYSFSGSTAQTYATDNSIPFHAFPEVTYDSQGGSAVPSGYVVYSGETVDAPDEPTWDGHIFGGWYPTSACDTTAVTFPYTVTATPTLFAKWTELTLDSAVASGTIYTGGRIVLTPNNEGGTWDYDPSYLSRNGNEFTALKRGTSTITYTVGGARVSYDVTIRESVLPATGQDFTGVWVLSFIAIATMIAGLLLEIRRKRKSV